MLGRPIRLLCALARAMPARVRSDIFCALIQRGLHPVLEGSPTSAASSSFIFSSSKSVTNRRSREFSSGPSEVNLVASRHRCRLRDVRTLRQAAAERDVLARRFVERDQKIIGRDPGSRDYLVVQSLQQRESLFLGTAGDERPIPKRSEDPPGCGTQPRRGFVAPNRCTEYGGAGN